MSNPLKSSNSASPFIKREQLRRDFLKSRLKKTGTPKPYVKKEDPEAYDERTNQLLNGNNSGGSSSSHRGIKQETATQYNEFPLRAVSHEHLENIRTHILKFQSKKKIDPKKDLHLPVRLHRKDTRNLQFQLTRAEIVQRQKEIADYKRKAEAERSASETGQSSVAISTPVPTDSGVASPTPQTSTGTPAETLAGTPEQTPMKTEFHEREGGLSASANNVDESNKSDINEAKPVVPPVTRLEEAGIADDPTKAGMVKYDGKEKPIETDGKEDPFADVAPDGGGRYKRGNVKRKTRSLKLLDENAKRLRFEEFYPWVLEDFDGLNTWVGSYEAGNSDSYVLLSVENDGSFTMIPADKVYKFTARNKYATLTIDEAEKRMEKSGKGIPRWLMKHLDDIGTTTTRYDRTQRRLRAVDARQGEEDDRNDNSEVELDFDEEFADDEEAPIIDGDEKENKESEQRIKKEMLQANAMGLRDDDEMDEDLFGEKKFDDEGEKTMKALQKSDMAALYDSDDESKLNPYLSESEAEKLEEDKEKEDSQENGKSSRKTSPRKKSPRSTLSGPRVHVKSIKDFQVVLKADKSILKNFPEGSWNPHAKKSNSNASSGASSPVIKIEDNAEHQDLLKEEDIINVVSGRKMTLKQLIKELKEKVAKHPSNKDRMKHLVKKLVKLNEGYLELNISNGS
ncbi:LANO_0E14136g1_1 [Lachancea nothofagi CBS 11611]|uniref:Transcription initiation factor IIF subunit alpha n=1 Tax=Lachancea nothofagi CBS 11611 TaxID=1266666 RepID=A0A1G4JZQ7_9SACH|nr:LANO_0E14136g1_1 [Lachancea nothofagi CBS 11611]